MVLRFPLILYSAQLGVQAQEQRGGSSGSRLYEKFKRYDNGRASLQTDVLNTLVYRTLEDMHDVLLSSDEDDSNDPNNDVEFRLRKLLSAPCPMLGSDCFGDPLYREFFELWNQAEFHWVPSATALKTSEVRIRLYQSAAKVISRFLHYYTRRSTEENQLILGSLQGYDRELFAGIEDTEARKATGYMHWGLQNKFASLEMIENIGLNFFRGLRLRKKMCFAAVILASTVAVTDHMPTQIAPHVIHIFTDTLRGMCGPQNRLVSIISSEIIDPEVCKPDSNSPSVTTSGGYKGTKSEKKRNPGMRKSCTGKTSSPRRINVLRARIKGAMDQMRYSGRVRRAQKVPKEFPNPTVGADFPVWDVEKQQTLPPKFCCDWETLQAMGENVRHPVWHKLWGDRIGPAKTTEGKVSDRKENFLLHKFDKDGNREDIPLSHFPNITAYSKLTDRDVQETLSHISNYSLLTDLFDFFRVTVPQMVYRIYLVAASRRIRAFLQTEPAVRGAVFAESHAGRFKVVNTLEFGRNTEALFVTMDGVTDQSQLGQHDVSDTATSPVDLTDELDLSDWSVSGQGSNFGGAASGGSSGRATTKSDDNASLRALSGVHEVLRPLAEGLDRRGLPPGSKIVISSHDTAEVPMQELLYPAIKMSDVVPLGYRYSRVRGFFLYRFHKTIHRCYATAFFDKHAGSLTFDVDNTLWGGVSRQRILSHILSVLLERWKDGKKKRKEEKKEFSLPITEGEYEFHVLSMEDFPDSVSTSNRDGEEVGSRGSGSSSESESREHLTRKYENAMQSQILGKDRVALGGEDFNLNVEDFGSIDVRQLPGSQNSNEDPFYAPWDRLFRRKLVPGELILEERASDLLRKHSRYILDIGAGLGSEAMWYIHTGFHIVSVESNYNSIWRLRAEYKTEIGRGQMNLLNYAIVSGETPPPDATNELLTKSTRMGHTADVYRNDTTVRLSPRAEQSTIVSKADMTKWVTLFAQGEEIESNSRGKEFKQAVRIRSQWIPSVTCGDLIKTFGMPHYLKIDVEDSSENCLKSIVVDSIFKERMRSKWGEDLPLSNYLEEKLNNFRRYGTKFRGKIDVDVAAAIVEGELFPNEPETWNKYLGEGVLTSKVGSCSENVAPGSLESRFKTRYRETDPELYKAVRAELINYFESLPGVDGDHKLEQGGFYGKSAFYARSAPPKYVSIEINTLWQMLRLLVIAKKLGYNKFKIARQAVFAPKICMSMGSTVSEGEPCGSGPMGEDVVDVKYGRRWRTSAQIIQDPDWKRQVRAKLDWFDLHMLSDEV